MKKWLKKESKTFSLITGESVTHQEVILAHLGFGIMIIVNVVVSNL